MLCLKMMGLKKKSTLVCNSDVCYLFFATKNPADDLFQLHSGGATLPSFVAFWCFFPCLLLMEMTWKKTNNMNMCIDLWPWTNLQIVVVLSDSQCRSSTLMPEAVSTLQSPLNMAVNANPSEFSWGSSNILRMNMSECRCFFQMNSFLA